MCRMWKRNHTVVKSYRQGWLKCLDKVCEWTQSPLNGFCVVSSFRRTRSRILARSKFRQATVVVFWVVCPSLFFYPSLCLSVSVSGPVCLSVWDHVTSILLPVCLSVCVFEVMPSPFVFVSVCVCRLVNRSVTATCRRSRCRVARLTDPHKHFYWKHHSYTAHNTYAGSAGRGIIWAFPKRTFYLLSISCCFPKKIGKIIGFDLGSTSECSIL